MKINIHTNDTETYPIDMGKVLVDYRKKLKRSQRGVQIFDAYDPSEKRDESGKWTAGGGSSKKQEQKQTTSFVSPNEDPENLSFEQAVSGLKTKRQKLLAAISHSIDSDLGINDIRINPVVGAWSDGAENSVMTNSESADPDIEEAAAAMKGYLANQKAVLLFHPDDEGTEFLAQFRTTGDLADIHQKLLDNGVIFHTLEPRGSDTIVHFYGETRADVDHFDKAAQSFGATVQAHPGHGKFIPPVVKEDGTDAEQRTASREAYQETISRVVATGKLGDSFESKWQNHIDNWERETGEQIGGGEYKPTRSERVEDALNDAFNSSKHPRGQPGNAGQFGPGGGGKSATPKQKPWIEELKEKQKNRPGVVTRAAHAATHGAVHLLGEFSKEDYEILKHHLAPNSKTRHQYASRILKIATLLPKLLQAHLKEEYHKFKNAGGALKAMATGKRPTSAQWKGLRQAATTVLLTGVVFMLTGDPTGGHVAQAATHAATQVGTHGATQVAGHVATQVAAHGAEHAAEHTAAAAAAHLTAEFGHELVSHTMLEHAAKFGLGFARLAARMAVSTAVGAGVTHLKRHQEEDTSDAMPDDTNTPIDANEMKLLQDYIQTLANVVIKHPIQDQALYDSLPDEKENKTKDEYSQDAIKRDKEGKFAEQGATEHEHPGVRRILKSDAPDHVKVMRLQNLALRAFPGSPVQKSIHAAAEKLKGSNPNWHPPAKESKTKDSRWRFLHVHTLDRIFRIKLKDAEFNPADHPHAPEGAPAGKGGQFVSKGSKPSGGNTSSPKKQQTAKAANTKPPKAVTPTPSRGSGALKGNQGHPGLISTALPKGKNDEFNKPNLELAKTDPKKFALQVQVFKDHPSAYPLNQQELEGDDNTVARNIIEHIKSNLKFIHDQTPKELRERTKKWYEGARKLVDEHVENYKEYNLKDTTVAGVYATLSPNNLWDQNVRQGDRMVDIYLKHRHEAWNEKMDKAVERTKNETVKAAMQDIAGKKYDELDTPEKKALWFRVYDEGHAVDNPEYKELGFQPFNKITPEGKREGWYTKPVNVSEYRAFAWTSTTLMGKAIRILEADGDPKVIDEALQTDDGSPPQHKVRSFYNNILDPHSKNEDVTMDTHAVDAAWFMDNPIAVAHNFGDIPELSKRPKAWVSGTPGSVKTGMTGNYVFNAEAYREAAHELDLEPRELQSIVWETKRKWMETMTDENHQKMRDVWNDYSLGHLTQPEAQKQVKQIIDDDLKMTSQEKRDLAKQRRQAKAQAKKSAQKAAA